MERLSAVDTAWFRMEESKNPVDILGVFVFEGPLDHALFEELVSRRLLRSRRFRQRVEQRRIGRPHWVEDDSLVLSDHLRFHRLRSGEGRAALESAIAVITSAAFDVRRPLWELHVFDGYEGERSVLVARLHHAMGDGYALMALVLAMADESKASKPKRGHARDPLARRPRHGLRDLAESAAHLVRLPFDPVNHLRGKLSGRRRCAWSVAIPMARITGIGTDMHATVNDVVLTALAGTLRRYLRSRGEAVDALSIRAVIPVNLRSPRTAIDWDRLGNAFGLVYLDLPVHLEDPVERLLALRRSMEELKRSPEAFVSRGLLFALGFVPTRVSRLIDAFFARKASIVATNVPGPKASLTFAGTRVQEAVFFVPHPGRLAVGVSILSYAGTLRVGVRADTAVLDDPAAIVRAFEEELDALGARAGPEAMARRRASPRPSSRRPRPR
jgi:diacylglycerol O-acyltransferase / wax synthase